MREVLASVGGAEEVMKPYIAKVYDRVRRVFPTVIVSDAGKYLENIQAIRVVLPCRTSDLVVERTWHETVRPPAEIMANILVKELSRFLMQHPEHKMDERRRLPLSPLPPISHGVDKTSWEFLDKDDAEPRITFDVPSMRQWIYPTYQYSWSW